MEKPYGRLNIILNQIELDEDIEEYDSANTAVLEEYHTFIRF